MTGDRYRSYVVRVRRTGPTASMRLDVEDLLDGGRASVSGDRAASLAGSLERLLARGVPDEPGAAAPADAQASKEP